MRESYSFLFVVFLLHMFYSLHSAFTHAWTHMHMPHPQHSLAIETLPYVHFVSMREKVAIEGLCGHAVNLGFCWVGHCSTRSQFHFLYFGFWFHQEVNNCDTSWVQKDEELANAESANFPQPDPHHSPT